MTDEPRRPGRPRKVNEPLAPVPPGPIQLEIRVNGKIACMQRVHSYNILQEDDKLTVTGLLRKNSDMLEQVSDDS